MKFMIYWPFLAIWLFAATSLRGESSDRDPVFELEAFIVEETAQTLPETLSAIGSQVDSFYGTELSVLKIPRSVSVLSPELMELLRIDSYEALDKIGAGTQRVNYFGLAGSAFIRGARAGTYFNGMLRAYQRNEMPMSFGAFDGLELIKGPVPSQFSPTLVGGAVNQRPKKPFFDRARGSIELTIGSWGERRLQIDFGAPLFLAGKPAAYRFSYTANRAERFYENVNHDFDSLYASAKVKLSSRHRLFLGGEVYRFRSGEMPGVNRPTPELIREREYVIGESPGLLSDDWGGGVVRPLLEFPYNKIVNPALFALAIPGETARRRIEPELLAEMSYLGDPIVVENLYSLRAPEAIPAYAEWAIPEAARLLGQVDRRTVDAYLYTPQYLEAGGNVLTVQLPKERILSDPRDKADSGDFIGFAELESRLDNSDRVLTRLFLESLETEKRSTYGFAMDTTQLVLEGNSEWQGELTGLNLDLMMGGSIRFTRAETLQDFDAEPFSRRDLSRAQISENSVVSSGNDTDPNGLNFWSVFGNASQESELTQTALYFAGMWKGSERLKIHFGARAENAAWQVGLPGELDRASEEDLAQRADSGNDFLWQFNLNPVWELRSGVSVYGAVQLGKALAPGDGGTVVGGQSFTDVELYESGVKASLLGERLLASLGVYSWKQASFSSLDAAARPLRARGLEMEITYSPIENLTLLGAFTAQRVTLRSELLGYGTIPQNAAGWALNGGQLNAASGRVAAENPDMVFAGLPEHSAHLYAIWSFPSGFSLSGGPLWRNGYYHDMQRAMKIPGYTLWNIQLGYEWEDWWARLHIENLFDTFYWIGQEPVFSAGSLILQGEGRQFRLTLGRRF